MLNFPFLIFKISCYVFKFFSGLAPKCLTDLLTYYASLRSLRSADQLLLHVLKTGLKNMRRSAFQPQKLYSEFASDVSDKLTVGEAG